MFPNVRLLAGAFVASIVALTCGFGLFAEFRVNHEPLSRLRVSTAPVRFANDAVAPRAGWGTPFDGQSRLNGPQRAGIAADAPAATVTGTIKLEAASASTAAPVTPVALTRPAIEPGPPREIAQPAEVIEPVVTVTQAAAPMAKPPSPPAAGQISRSASAAGGATGQTEPSASTLAAGPADAAASPEGAAPHKAASIPSASTVSLSDADSAQPTGTIAAAAAPQPGSDAAPSKQNSESAEAAPTPPLTPVPSPVVAAAAPSDQPEVVVPPMKEGALLPAIADEPAKAAAKPVRKIGAKQDGKIVRKLLARRRLAVRRRGVRRLRRSASRDGLGDPVFQSAPNFSGATASRSGYNSPNW